jgi:hypothetical protein
MENARKSFDKAIKNKLGFYSIFGSQRPKLGTKTIEFWFHSFFLSATSLLQLQKMYLQGNFH